MASTGSISPIPPPTHNEVEYKFLRLDVSKEEDITQALNEWYQREEWLVISHNESDGEYSFVLIRARP